MQKSIWIAFWLLAGIPMCLMAQDPAYPTAPPTPQSVVKGEFFVDTDPGFGNGTVISFTPGVDVNAIPIAIPTGGLIAGVHHLFIRTLNAEGKWSVTSARSFIVDFDPAYPPNPAPLNIVKAEQFVDDDPGFGNAINIPLTPAIDVANIPAMVNTGSLSLGVHRVFVRTLNAEGEWSMSSVRSFIVDADPPYPVAPASPLNIVEAEYFVNTDPGVGSGTNIPLTPTVDLSGQSASIDIMGLPAAAHKLYIRTFNAEGKWSVTSFSNFVINEDPFYPTAPAAPGNITRVEYFIDNDPGFGNGIAVSITPGVDIADRSFAANVGALSGGVHRLYIRSLDDWSLTSVREFVVEAPSPKVVVSGALTGDFQTLKAAADAINAGGGSGAVTVTVVDNTTETATASFTQTNYTVQVIPNGNRIVQGNIAAPIVLLNGADNVTIDGQSHTGANTLTFRNTNTDPLAHTIRIDGPAENNIVKRCIVEGSCNGSFVITGIIAITAADNGNSVNNRIDSNLVRPATSSGASNGIAVSTSSNASTSRINNAQITNNSIQNIFISSNFLNHGVVVSRNANNTLIKGNSVYNSAEYNNTFTDAEYYGIRVAAVGGSGSGVIIDSNFVGGNAPGSAGNKMVLSSANRFRFNPILMADNTVNTSSVTRNTVRNFDLTVTNPATTANTAFVGIWINTGSIQDYHHNIVGGEANNSIVLQNNVSSTGTVNNFLHRIERPVANAVTDNTAAGISLTTNALSGSTAVPTLSMFSLSGTHNAINFKRNAIGAATADNIKITSNTSSVLLLGIDEFMTGANPAIQIDSNTVRNIRVTGAGSVAAIRHITNAVVSPVVSIKGNSITAIAGSGTNNSIRAIQTLLTVDNTNNTVDISGNTISNLTAPAGAGVFVQGIRIFGSGIGNTIKGRIDKNVVADIVNGSVGGFGAAGIAVTHDVANADSLVIAGNIVRNISSASDAAVTGEFGNSTGVLYAASLPNMGRAVVRDNVVSAIASTSTANAALRSFGISTTGNHVVTERNRVFDLSNASVSSTALMAALHMAGLAGDNATGLVRNNMLAINANTGTAIHALSLGGGDLKANVYHNSVLVEGNTSAKTHALFFTSTATADVKNNILYNAATGSGAAFAIGAESGLSGYTGNHNYMVSTAANALAEQNGTALDIAGWRTLTMQDANTETGVSGVNTNAANLFINRSEALLLVNTTDVSEPVKMSNKGFALSALVPTDFLGQVRNATTPDIGAHEFVFSNPLPVTLISFTGTRQNNNALLQWRTANEVNLSAFELQRSYDGQKFNTVAGVLPGLSKYTYTDADIFQTTPVVFYRLKSIDLDGQFAYSVIVKLSRSSDASITAYPNPVRDVVTISGLQPGGTIRLLDAAGRILWQQKANAPTTTVSMQRYAAGWYVLQYVLGNTLMERRIIKQ